MLSKNIGICNDFINFLKIIAILLLSTLIYTKYKIYKLKINIKSIENQIVMIEKQKEYLVVEWSYLTNPQRLINIYNNIKLHNNQINFEEKIFLSSNQIKDLNKLITYYYSKVQYNKDKSIVQK